MHAPRGRKGMAPAAPVVKVRRELLEACLTCPLCGRLLRDATTISECLHTFCRKCIYEKLSDEELECCPICSIDLGCTPIEKLRQDHNLQDVRAKIFPLRIRKDNAPEATPSIVLPVRRKERSLSSLVVNSPRVPTQSGLTGRRTKAFARKEAALKGSSSVIDESIKKDEGNAEELLEGSSSPETLSKMSYRRQSTSAAETYHPSSNKSNENGTEQFVDRPELWKPLNCLVEVANRTKSMKPSPQVEQSKAPDSEINTHKMKHPHKSKVRDEKNNAAASASTSTKRFHGSSRKRTAAARDLCSSAQALLDTSSIRREKGTGPVWFSLIASADQEADTALPQIAAFYLRIKDGNLPASFIQKYLARKLDLPSEAEVEITCRDEPIASTLELHKLVDLWLRGGSSQKALATVRNSANDFVMVLKYSRRVLSS